jgi:hypothetical protein
MDPILFAIITVVVIAGPCVLALALWANRDRRRSQRRAAENPGDPNWEHLRRPSWQGGCTRVGATAAAESAAGATAAEAAGATAAGRRPG